MEEEKETEMKKDTKLGGKTSDDSEGMRDEWALVWKSARKNENKIVRKRMKKGAKKKEDEETGDRLKGWMGIKTVTPVTEDLVLDTIATVIKKLGVVTKKDEEKEYERKKRKEKFDELMSNFEQPARKKTKIGTENVQKSDWTAPKLEKDIRAVGHEM